MYKVDPYTIDLSVWAIADGSSAGFIQADLADQVFGEIQSGLADWHAIVKLVAADGPAPQWVVISAEAFDDGGLLAYWFCGEDGVARLVNVTMLSEEIETPLPCLPYGDEYIWYRRSAMVQCEWSILTLFKAIVRHCNDAAYGCIPDGWSLDLEAVDRRDPSPLDGRMALRIARHIESEEC